MPRLERLLRPDLVAFVEGSRPEVMSALCKLATGSVEQQRSLEPGLAAREEIASTALECGVAVPHCHVRQLDEFVVALGISRLGIDWDGQTVHAVLLVGAPEHRQLDYLRLLSSVATLCERPGLGDQLAACADGAAAIQLLTPPSDG